MPIRAGCHEGTDMSGPAALPEVGAPAPQIDEPITGGGRFVLSEHRGAWVVVYFYPRANTPG